MGSATRPIVAMLVVAAAAIAFWMLLLSPKRDEASELAVQAEQLSAKVTAAQSELAQGTAAQRAFPTAYHQLVELGQAVPASDETPSLLIELETLAVASGVGFEGIQLEGEGGAAPEVPAAPAPTTEATTGSSTATPAAETVPPTEVEAALLPLGASIGSAGLAVMPYTLNFSGNFFQIASFIGQVDDLVKSGKSVTVDGRLVTINGFSLTTGTSEGASVEGGEANGPTELQATFSVTTYLTPPGQGATASATPTAPATETASQTVAAE
jgi:Tfp pilus assembly protein PilO